MNIICLGLSHQTAGVELRERFAVADADLVAAASELEAREGIHGAVVVSTCNRVEFYAAAEKPEHGFRALNEFLHARACAHHYDDTIFYKYDAPQSIRHLFRVVCGLDSMVLGETEILGQVKKAYAAAAGSGAASPHLNKLFQRGFHVAKEVRSKTNITRGAVSVGSVAVDLAEKIFGRLQTCKVIILGAGETAEQTARAFLLRGLRSVFVSNRSYDRAVALAGEMGGEAIRFDEWDGRIADMDVIIGSTSAPHPVLTRAQLELAMAGRRNRPLFVIDLAVPRDVEPSANEVEGVYLYDIDSLRAIAEQSMTIRRQELATCEQMIERHVHEFSEWLALRGNGSAPLPAAARLAVS